MLSSRKVNRVRRKMRSVSKRSLSKSRLSKGRTISKRLSRRRLKSKLSRKFTKVGGKSKLRSRHKLTKCRQNNRRNNRKNNRKNNQKTKRRTRLNKKQSGGKPIKIDVENKVDYKRVYQAVNDAIGGEDKSPYEIKILFQEKFKELVIDKAFGPIKGERSVRAQKLYDDAQAEMYKLSEQLEKEARDQYIVNVIDTLNVSAGTILDDVDNIILKGFPSLIPKPTGRNARITYFINFPRSFERTDNNILEEIRSRVLDLMAVCSQNLKLLNRQSKSGCIEENISVMTGLLKLSKTIFSKIPEIYEYKTTFQNWVQMAKIIEKLDPPIKGKTDSGSAGLSYSTFTQNWYLHKFNEILDTPIDILSFIDAFNKADDDTKTTWKTTIDQNRKPNNSNSLYEQRQVVPVKVDVPDPRKLC